MAIKQFSTPTTVKDLKEFVGLLNYYHRFALGIASIMALLYSAPAGKPMDLTWDRPQSEAFQKVKDALAVRALLAFPIPGKPLLLTMDASDVAIGAVLEQVVQGQPRPLAFFSSKLLAVHQAVRHFRHFLEGITFKIRTDHIPLVYAFIRQADAWSSRQRRHLSAFAEFNCSLRYLPGKRNPVADALTRVSIDAVQVGLDYNQLAKTQEEDPEIAACRTSITSLTWKDVPMTEKGTTVLCDVSTGRSRPWIPDLLRHHVFNLIHGLSHPVQQHVS